MKYNYKTSNSIIMGIFYFVLLNFIRSDKILASQAIKDEKLMTKISYNYLRSFTIAQKASPVIDLASMVQQQGKLKGKPIFHPSQIKLAEPTQRKVVLRTLFSTIELNRFPTAKDILNYNAWTDLTLFCGESSNPAYHLLSRINRTTTVLGECVLATLLVTPTNDVTVLLNRQKMIRLLLEEPECLNALKETLAIYRKVESRLLSLWTHTDPFYTKEYREYMQRRFLSDTIAVNKNAAKLNRRIFFRNIKDIWSEPFIVPFWGTVLCGGQYFMTSISKGGFVRSDAKASFEPFGFFIPGYSIYAVINNYKKTDGQALLLPFVGAVAMHGLFAWRVYCGVKCYQEYKTVFRHLAMRMRDIQVLIQTMQQLDNMVANNPKLEVVYGDSLREIRKLLLTSNESTELGTMVSNLLNMKLDNWSYIGGNGGRLLATYHLFEEHKDCLAPAMYALGLLDSFTGIATLIADARMRHPVHAYTFTKFLDRSEQKTPCITFHAMWNPLLDPQTVVANDVAMDVHKTRNIVLCGPNAGGKSSFLSGVATALLLSQTFGIAPAKQVVITPFNKIKTYIKARDDIASNVSLFMVEVNRIQKYIHMLEKSQSDEFIFSISDELFASTNPVEGSAAAYSAIECMAKYPNALHIVSSHYPIVMALERNVKGRGIRNFKVFVKEIGDNKLHYTYKIVPGAATQTVALKLLEQEGYDPALINQAKYIVQHPEKFYNSFGKGK